LPPPPSPGSPPRDGALKLGDRVEFLVQEDLRGRQRAVEVRRASGA